MKHPFWLINSTLLLFLGVILLFIVASWQGPVVKVSFEPDATLKPVKKEITKIDLSKIYANDLFNTYAQPLPSITSSDYTKPIPQPPIPKPPPAPVVPQIKFLEPLKINLRGIIVASDERVNIAIIEDTKTIKAKNYKVGDIIEDAQLIRILKNKIILIRSNGQQETLYVSQHDAELEQLLLQENNWATIIKKTSENSYSIDPDLFADRIKNLAQFIDMLNLITVYRQGQSIGCRIGKVDKNSLAFALGLAPGDIIQSINNISAAETHNRFEIYKTILELPPASVITVEIMRKGTLMTITYTLEKLEAATTLITTPTEIPPFIHKEKTRQEIEQEKKELLEEKYRFAPTAEELQKKEKQAMLKLSQHNKKIPVRQNRDTIMNNVKT